MRSDVATVPGWYGKLPTLGDFASRRLEADFIEPWDLWLGEAMQAQRDALGEGWLEAYRSSPPWRFLLTPGALPGEAGTTAFAGILAASLDRVGRRFPLTLAASLARVPASASEYESLLAWLHRLEDVALDALSSEWGVDDLEQALAALPPPGGDAATPAIDRLAPVQRALREAMNGGGGFVDIGALSSRAELAAAFAGSDNAAAVSALPAQPLLHGVTLWWADAPARPQLLVCAGLPQLDQFVRMFVGDGAGIAAEPSTAPLAAAGIPDDVDLLALFDPEATRPLPLAGTLSGEAPKDDDILALFGAVGAAPLEVADLPARTVDKDDPLALFGVTAEDAAKAGTGS